jgi:hypothetical protein
MSLAATARNKDTSLVNARSRLIGARSNVATAAKWVTLSNGARRSTREERTEAEGSTTTMHLLRLLVAGIAAVALRLPVVLRLPVDGATTVVLPAEVAAGTTLTAVLL